MLKITFAAVITFLCLMPGAVLAHHAPGVTGTSQAGPILTTSATTMHKGGLAFTLQSSYVNIEDFSDNELLGFAEQGNDVHTFDYLYSVSAAAAYGITDDLTLSLRIPYNSFNNIREAHSDEPDEIHQHGDSRGIGDMTLLAHYRFLNMPPRQFESAVIFGLKVPTGKTDDKDIHGDRFETEHQPGSGSWDPVIGVAVTKRFERISLDADLRYTLVTEGSQDTDLGDLMNYNLAVSYHVPGKLFLDLVLEANGEWKQKQEISGSRDENSGAHVLYVSPGMRIRLNKAVSAFISVGIPAIQDMNGIQSETNYRTLFGVSVGL
ncbi:MAG: transporter [Nitrospirota bacterium]|nr:transporter [Nitrospirota bacterium]